MAGLRTMAAALVGLVTVHCSFTNMEQVLTEMLHKALNITDSRMPGRDLFRKTSVSTSLAAIDHYGCWCYFGDNHGKGKGTPVNEVDEFCKVLHDGYDCAILDGKLDSEPCEPWLVDYKGSVQLGLGTQEQVIIDCSRKNPDDKCAERACLVENNFVLNIFGAFLSGTTFDPTKKHALHQFDPVAECGLKEAGTGSGNGNDRKKACCGNYPARFPFFHVGNHRACCGEKTYSTTTYQCCGAPEYEVKYSCL